MIIVFGLTRQYVWLFNHLIYLKFSYMINLQLIQMFIGEFSPSIFFKVCTYVIISTLVIIYYLSQALGHQDPFPHCWISGCAGHYPEFIFFRIATISGSVLVILGWMTNHFYLLSISKEAVFNIKKYHPQVGMILGMIGAMMLMGSTANIDTGRTHPKWHGHCAVSFFVSTVLALIYNTLIYCIVRNKIGIVNLNNLYFKLVLLVLIVIQGYIGNKNGLFELEEGKVASVIGVIIEWTLTITVVLGFYSMSLDVQNFKFVYEMGPKKYIQDEID